MPAIYRTSLNRLFTEGAIEITSPRAVWSCFKPTCLKLFPVHRFCFRNKTSCRLFTFIVDGMSTSWSTHRNGLLSRNHQLVTIEQDDLAQTSKVESNAALLLKVLLPRPDITDSSSDRTKVRCNPHPLSSSGRHSVGRLLRLSELDLMRPLPLPRLLRPLHHPSPRNHPHPPPPPLTWPPHRHQHRPLPLRRSSPRHPARRNTSGPTGSPGSCPERVSRMSNDG